MTEGSSAKLQLEVVTPDREVIHEAVDSASIPGKGGYLGILPGHAPLLSELQPGEMQYTRGKQKHFLALSAGFAEVLPDRIIILAETAERAEEIDLERAERSKQRAEDRLRKLSDPEIGMERGRASLERALARIQAARRIRA